MRTRIPADEVRVVKILHRVEPGIDHYQRAVLEYNGKYYLGSRLCAVIPNGPGPIEAIICYDKWFIFQGPFNTIEEAIKKYREIFW